MANYMIAYYGGDKPNSKEEGKAHMDKWNAWVQGLGEKVVNPGTPLMDTKVLTLTDVHTDNDPNTLKGFAVIKADSMESAIEMAKSDPFLTINGTIRISHMMEMN